MLTAGEAQQLWPEVETSRAQVHGLAPADLHNGEHVEETRRGAERREGIKADDVTRFIVRGLSQ